MYIRKGGRDEGTEGGREGERDRERVWEAGSPGRDGGSIYVYEWMGGMFVFVGVFTCISVPTCVYFIHRSYGHRLRRL